MSDNGDIKGVWDVVYEYPFASFCIILSGIWAIERVVKTYMTSGKDNVVKVYATAAKKPTANSEWTNDNADSTNENEYAE